jgi:hypothetical protein
VLGKSKQNPFNIILNHYDVVANELINNTGNIEIKGIYPPNQTEAERINLLNLSDGELEYILQKTADNTSEPILYQLSTHTEIPTYENTLPIHRKYMTKQTWRCMNYIQRLRNSTQIVSSPELKHIVWYLTISRKTRPHLTYGEISKN